MSVAPSTEQGSLAVDAEPRAPRKWVLFWRTVTKFEKNKIVLSLAIRNAIGVAIPLLVGILTDYKLSGLAVASGALNVSFSDGQDGYGTRARRMLVACGFIALAVFAGGIVGRHNTSAVLVACAAGFSAGIAVCLGTTAADIGVITLVTLIVYSAQSLSFANAAWAGLLALMGALFQTGLALVLWPMHRYGPERRSLGLLYSELAQFCSISIDPSGSPAASQATTAAQQMLAELGSDHRIESERYRSLLSQAERVRLCLLMLRRLERRLIREANAGPAVNTVAEIFSIAGDILYSVSACLSGHESTGPIRRDLVRFAELAEQLRALHTSSTGRFSGALIADAQLQVDALGGQLRVIVDLTEHSTVEGLQNFAAKESALPQALRLSGVIATLRANLTLDSTACRHAIRLAVCIGAGDALGRALGWGRSYWLPMTIAIILKPDFTSTFSRGVLRLLGTFLGLGVATVLFHFLPGWSILGALMAGVYMFALRSIGAANYGIFVVLVSGLVVILIELAGVPARQVISARAVNTASGGALALIAYIVWPTWERHQWKEQLARLLDAYRVYLQTLTNIYTAGAAGREAELSKRRLEARLARSNAEASVDRLRAEPGAIAEEVSIAIAMLTASHRFVHALMALDAGLASSRPVPPRDAFKKLASDMDLTLYFLSSVLRGGPYLKKHYPDLRADHRRLIESGDQASERYALSNIETDRMANSLNTIRECVVRLAKSQ